LTNASLRRAGLLYGVSPPGSLRIGRPLVLPRDFGFTSFMETIKAVRCANGKTILGSTGCQPVLPRTARASAYGFVARMSGDGPGGSSLRTFLLRTSSLHLSFLFM